MALAQGSQFKCNATICFGIGAVHEQFKQLQSELNRFAAIAGFELLDVDGFIGAKTVAMVQRVAQLLRFPSPGVTQEAVAARTPELLVQLQNALGGDAPALVVADAPPEIESTVAQTLTACRLDRRSAPCQSAKQLCRRVRGTASASLPGVTELCVPRIPIWVWFATGGAALGAVGTLVYRRHRRRRLAT